MNEDWMQELEPRAGEELERTMARYARVRLDPSPAQTRRTRAAVMEQAWRRRLDAPAEIPASLVAAVPAARTSRRLYATWSGRRFGASFAAAVVAGLMLGSSAFAASRAGGPLYDARLAIEAITLPSDPTSRLEAELAQAQTRIAEITEASSRGDEGAVAAAVTAYLHTLDELDQSTGAPAERALEAVRFHQAILLQLLGTVPEDAIGGIQQALDQSGKAIERLNTVTGGQPATDPAGAGGGDNGGNTGGNAGSGGSGGNAGGNAGSGGSGGNAGGNAGSGGSGGNAGGNDGGTKPPKSPPPTKSQAPKP